MKTVSLLMSNWENGEDSWQTVQKAYQKRAAADHQAALLNEARLRPEVSYYVVDWSVE